MATKPTKPTKIFRANTSYGMNFSHPTSPWAMPELHWYFGYPLIWVVMIAVVAGLLYFFRRRDWL